MSSVSFDSCTICQYPLVTSGIFHPLNNLLLQRQVRKLDGCDHQFHTACFQDWVNMKLATNTNHRGPVPCPTCRVETEETHSAQDFFNVVPSFQSIAKSVSIISAVLSGLAAYCIQTASRASDKIGKTSYSLVGVAFIITAIALNTLFRQYTGNHVKQMYLLLAYYNLRKGTHVKRKDIAFGMDINLTRQEWLNAYCDFIPSIGLIFQGESKQLKQLNLTITNRKLFIQKIEQELDAYEGELPDAIQNAGKHFYQYMIDSDKQAELLGFLTNLVIQKKIISIEQQVVRYDYSQITYEHFHYPDET